MGLSHAALGPANASMAFSERIVSILVLVTEKEVLLVIRRRVNVIAKRDGKESRVTDAIATTTRLIPATSIVKQTKPATITEPVLLMEHVS
jgi:hypothetical protein